MRRPDPELDRARATTRSVAHTFALACRLLPREVRDDVYRLYLFFRTLDDLVDTGDRGAADRIAAVEAWDPASPDVALLRDVERRHPLPREAIAEFCRGMRCDLEGEPVRTEADLDRYCFRVAGTVGVVMSAVLGVRGDEADAHRDAAALGAAMQRTNILRDIDEDLAAGRVYLPVADPADLAPGRRAALLRAQIARADVLYDQGIAGIHRLASGRVAVRAAAVMYREILRQIERDGYGNRPGRAVVPRRRKLALAATSLAA